MGNIKSDATSISSDESYRKLIALLGDKAPILWRRQSKFKSPDNKNRAFFTKAYFRPACDGVHVGGAMVYITSKDDEGHWTESLRQTMKTDQQIDYIYDHDPYAFSPNRRFSHKTEIERIAERGNQGRNTYCSVALYWGNAFKNGGRKNIENIMSVDRIVLDLDGPDHRILSKKEKMAISSEIQTKIGTADFVVDSGSGIQLHYLFKERSDVFLISRYYNFINKKLCQEAENAIKSVPGCHADTLKINAVYRLPMTFNTHSKSKSYVMEFHDLEPFDFDDLVKYFDCREILAEKTKKQTNQKLNGKASYKNAHTCKKFSLELEHDYMIIAAKLGNPGRRNMIIYYCSYNLQGAITDKIELTRKAQLINKCFADPLTESEVKTIVNSAIAEYTIHQRVFSFSSQLEKIGISHEEVAGLDLLLPVTESQKEERQRQASRKQSKRRKELRHTKKMERINQIIALYQKGLSFQKISQVTGIDRHTISKWIKENT